MAGYLEVDTDAAFSTSRSVSADAEELREGVAELSHEWANVSRGWSGAAASAYSPLFQEWQEGAARLVESLAESANLLAEAAVRYQHQDTASSESVDATARQMGL
ncbi:WXG100 family type VII secretion target [Mycobacterium sp. MBM]|nr:WXG100 family type VII secretion target [Mycobacterium sp. MBM]